MAENESLDLDSPNARRWDAVYDAVRKGQSCDKVADQVRERFHKGLQKALKQFVEKGVTLATLLEHRDSPATLERLLHQVERHEYAELFADTARAEKGSSPQQLLEAFVGGIWGTISDQIAWHVAGSGHWPCIGDIQHFLNQVRDRIRPDVRRIAQKLAADPTKMPRAAKSGNETNPTADMLGMSLLGIQRQ